MATTTTWVLVPSVRLLVNRVPTKKRDGLERMFLDYIFYESECRTSTTTYIECTYRWYNLYNYVCIVPIIEISVHCAYEFHLSVLHGKLTIEDVHCVLLSSPPRADYTQNLIKRMELFLFRTINTFCELWRRFCYGYVQHRLQATA